MDDYLRNRIAHTHTHTHTHTLTVHRQTVHWQTAIAELSSQSFQNFVRPVLARSAASSDVDICEGLARALLESCATQRCLIGVIQHLYHPGWSAPYLPRLGLNLA